MVPSCVGSILIVSEVPTCPISEIKGRRQNVPISAPALRRLQRGRRTALEVIVLAVPKSLYFAGATARRLQTINSDDIRPGVLASLRPCDAPPATVLFDVIDDVVVSVTHVPAAAAKIRFSTRCCELVLQPAAGHSLPRRSFAVVFSLPTSTAYAIESDCRLPLNGPVPPTRAVE